MVAFGAVLAVGVYLNVRLGLNTPERQDTLADSLFALVTLCLSLALGFPLSGWCWCSLTAPTAVREGQVDTVGDVKGAIGPRCWHAMPMTKGNGGRPLGGLAAL